MLNQVLHDLFVEACAETVEAPFRNLLMKECWGCLNPSCAYNEMAHDVCLVMPAEKQTMFFLPAALKQVPRQKLVDAFCDVFKREIERRQATVGKRLLTMEDSLLFIR